MAAFSSLDGPLVRERGSVRIGLISDIHGNRHALKAVLADGASQGVNRWWVLGDLVAIGPDPVGTVELIANLPSVEVTTGNTERYVLTDDPPTVAAEVTARRHSSATVRCPGGRARIWLRWS